MAVEPAAASVPGVTIPGLWVPASLAADICLSDPPQKTKADLRYAIRKYDSLVKTRSSDLAYPSATVCWGSIRNRGCILYPRLGTFVLIRPAHTFYERIKYGNTVSLTTQLKC